MLSLLLPLVGWARATCRRVPRRPHRKTFFGGWRASDRRPNLLQWLAECVCPIPTAFMVRSMALPGSDSTEQREFLQTFDGGIAALRPRAKLSICVGVCRATPGDTLFGSVTVAPACTSKEPTEASRRVLHFASSNELSIDFRLPVENRHSMS